MTIILSPSQYGRWLCLAISIGLCCLVGLQTQAKSNSLEGCGGINAANPQAPSSSFCDISRAAIIPDSTETNATDYAFLIIKENFDGLGNEVVLGISDDGVFDFTDFEDGEYCFYGFAYYQRDIDSIGVFLNANHEVINSIVAIDTSLLPLPIPLPLEVLLNISEDLFPSDLTIDNLLASLEFLYSFAPISSFDFCYNIVPQPYCSIKQTGECCSSITQEEIREEIMGQTYVRVDLTATIEGAQAPYTFQWSNGEIEENSDDNSHTIAVSHSMPVTYYITITDASDCVITDSITVAGKARFCNTSPSTDNQPKAPSFTDFTYIITDSQTLDENGEADIITVSSDGAFDFINYGTGEYCFQGFSYNQTDLDTLAILINQTPTLAASIGMTPTYLPLPIPWSLETLIEISKELSTDNIFTINDLLNSLDLINEVLGLAEYDVSGSPYCLDIVSATVDLGEDQKICLGQSIKLEGDVAGSYFTWYKNDTVIASASGQKELWVSPSTTSVYQLSVGEFFCTRMDEITVEVGCDSPVWPGDADTDGIANNRDVLAIALAYNNTGEQRPNASTEWQPEYCEDWSTTINENFNDKHADCNGDGQIDTLDLAVIDKNYRKIVEKGNNIVFQSETDIPLYCELPENVVSGESVRIPIYLGTEEIAAENIYGIAFSFSIQTTDSITIKESVFHYNNSWIGEENNRITFSKQLEGYQWDIAVARIDRQTQTGSGLLCEIDYIMEVGSLLKSGDTSLIKLPFSVFFHDVELINTDSEVIPVAPYPEESTLTTQPTHTTTISNNKPPIEVFPNPSRNHLQIKANLSSKSTTYTLSLRNITGQKMIEQQLTAHQLQQHHLNVSQLKTGIYWLQISDGKELWTKKVMILD